MYKAFIPECLLSVYRQNLKLQEKSATIQHNQQHLKTSTVDWIDYHKGTDLITAINCHVSSWTTLGTI
jgi:hypothetical protein